MHDRKLIRLMFIDCDAPLATERELTRALLKVHGGCATPTEQELVDRYITFLESFFEGRTPAPVTAQPREMAFA